MPPRPFGRLLIDPFIGYCRQRLADDPFLPLTQLQAELVELGYTGTYCSTWDKLFVRGVTGGPRRIYPKPVPVTQTMPTTSRRAARPLPIPVRPITGETLDSYLSRICTANHVEHSVLTRLLPDWFARIARDERVRAPRRPSDMVAHLADIIGLPANTLARALPELGLADDATHRPTYATTACRRCLAVRGITHPVPVRLPRRQRLCTRHAIWISGPHQIDVAPCPEITTAQLKAARLCRRHTPVQLLFAELTAHSRYRTPGFEEWNRRFHLLEDRNPSLDPESLLGPATYPDTITKAAEFLKRRFGP